MNFLLKNQNQIKKKGTFAETIRLEEQKLIELKNKINLSIEEKNIDNKLLKNKAQFNTQDFFPKIQPDKHNNSPSKNKKYRPIGGKNKHDSNRTKISMIDLIIPKFPPLSLSVLNNYIPLEIKNYDIKTNNYLKGVSSFTKQGLVRSRNDNRIIVLLNVPKPENIFTNKWPFCCFFGIYDGHNGTLCADFLKDNLHNFIFQDKIFIDNPKQAIRNGFSLAEKRFIEEYAINKNTGVLQDFSGSCAIVCVIVDDMCYFANLGDSRGVLSSETGKNINQINIEHTPTNEGEKNRIKEMGGKIYQKEISPNMFNFEEFKNGEVFVGPQKIFPGRLSVTRSIGDVTAKFKQYGGIENLYLFNPDICSFRIIGDLDFLIIGSNGLFEHLSNKELTDCAWLVNHKEQKADTLKEQCGLALEMITKTVISRVCLDNFSCIFIAFNNYEKLFSYSIHTIDNSTLKKILIDTDFHLNHKSIHDETAKTLDINELELDLSPSKKTNQSIRSALVKTSKFKDSTSTKIRNFSSINKKSYNSNFNAPGSNNDVLSMSSLKKLSFNFSDQKNNK